MRVRDLIPDAQALLTRRYWRNRAAIVNGQRHRVSIPRGSLRPRPNNLNQAQANGTVSSNGAPGQWHHT